jgi:acyl-CoA thioester hydrolase
MNNPTKTSRPYLEETTTLRVRFHEVDSMNIVWHGHYVVYFEAGRRAFGCRYGIDYPVFVAHGVAAPVVNLWLDFKQPARMGDELTITTRLLKPAAAKTEFVYEIHRGRQLLVTGGTVQVFTKPDGELLLAPPPFIQERYRQWEPLWIQS